MKVTRSDGVYVVMVEARYRVENSQSERKKKSDVAKDGELMMISID